MIAPAITGGAEIDAEGKPQRPQWQPGQPPQRHLRFCYRETSNISRTLVGNKIVDNSDVVGASPVGAAPTTSLFST